MRRSGSILLISCYELGHQPLGIASPLGFLERVGYAPDGLDISVESFDAEKVARARFVGISVPMHTALRLGIRVAERIRKINPTCHICFYGLYASLNADYLLDHMADSVIGGEFEMPLVALIEALEAGRPGEVKGTSRRGKMVGPFLKRLPFPVPSRGVLPTLEKYARLEQDGVRGLVGYVEASRGCLHHCLHCPIPPVYGGRFFVVPKGIVLEDIRRLVRAGATHITFGDPDFLNGPGHSLGVVRAQHDEFPELTFDFTAKVEHILKCRSLFPELGALGCVFMVSAVESLSDTVLANLEKGHTRADVFVSLAILRQAGIAPRPSLVSFTPWTTLDDYLDVLEFVEAEGLIDHVDPVQYTIRLLIPPGSALLSRPAIRPFLGLLDQASLSYRWTHPDPRMDHLHQAVSAAVEEATRAGEDPAVTFDRVRALAYAARGGRPPAAVSPTLPHGRSRPPRLTEPWFC
ncbi:MAG: radical SAM protein [candidate division NC10 bacterium]|nr:radical SAM protein [candidate division NC10 bacterium]